MLEQSVLQYVRSPLHAYHKMYVFDIRRHYRFFC